MYSHVGSSSICSQRDAIAPDETVGNNTHLACVRIQAIDLVWHDGQRAEMIDEAIAVAPYSEILSISQSLNVRRVREEDRTADRVDLDIVQTVELPAEEVVEQNSRVVWWLRIHADDGRRKGSAPRRRQE